jgi:hypothetical protein
VRPPVLKSECMSPIVLHIPHASKEIPSGVRSTFLPCNEKIERELLLMTNAWIG